MSDSALPVDSTSFSLKMVFIFFLKIQNSKHAACGFLETIRLFSRLARHSLTDDNNDDDDNDPFLLWSCECE